MKIQDIPCPKCGEKDCLREFEPYCEDCGNHSGYRCNKCDATFDHVWDTDDYELILGKLDD